MAWDKNHIKEIESNLKLVEGLGDNIGYIFLVQSALALYKHKCKRDFPVNYLSSKEIDSYDELIQKNKE